MSTSQFNIRISKELEKDLDSISDILKITKSEYVKVRLAEAVLADIENYKKRGLAKAKK